jgi:hypothetical protein
MKTAFRARTSGRESDSHARHDGQDLEQLSQILQGLRDVPEVDVTLTGFDSQELEDLSAGMEAESDPMVLVAAPAVCRGYYRRRGSAQRRSQGGAAEQWVMWIRLVI